MGSLMAKTDIKDAFRIIPVNPKDYHFLGFTWKGQFYYERCLPLGTSSSCQIFEKLGTALQWVMLNKLEAGVCLICWMISFLLDLLSLKNVKII